VSATVKTSTAMEAATAVEVTGTSVEPFAAMEATITAPEATTVETTMLEAFASPETPVAIKIPSVEATPVVRASIITTTVEAASVVAVEPRPGAYEDAAHKVVRAVVAVRRTSVWVVPVVAVGAHRSWTVVSRADSNADNDALRVGRSRQRKHANS
jgi:hypothetical protein